MILLHVDFPLFPIIICYILLILIDVIMVVVAVVDGDGDCLELVAVRHGSGDEGGGLRCCGVVVRPCTDRRDEFLKLRDKGPFTNDVSS